MLTLKDLDTIENQIKISDRSSTPLVVNDLVVARDLLSLAKQSLLFDGILGNLKQVLEHRCTSYGAEEPGNRCCFRYDMGKNDPCITCKTRRGLGYPCPACKKSH